MKRITTIDTKTIRTRRALRHTLESMICEMDFRQITVSELTQRAGVHRKTFYLHYETIEDLFYELSDEIAARMRAVVDEVLSRQKSFDLELCMDAYGRYLDENPMLHRQLFCNESYSFVYNRVQAATGRYFYDQLLQQADYDPEMLECATLFVTYGLNAIWRNYYQTGRPKDQAKIRKWTSVFSKIIQDPLKAGLLAEYNQGATASL